MSGALYTGTPYIQIGAVVINIGTSGGVTWTVSPIDGWDVPASLTDFIEQRNADSGGWAGPTYWEPRDLELKGVIASQDWSLLAQAWATLKAAVPSFTPVTLTVATRGAPVLQASVRQTEKPILNQEQAGRWEFSFALTALDPRRYDTTLTTASTGLPTTSGGLTLPVTLPVSLGATVTAGRITVTNEGDTSTRPVFTITGPCPPCTITHSSGRRLVIPEAVAAGRSLVLDTDARTAIVDGTASRVVTGTWFEFTPGVNDVQFSSATYDAAALLTVSFRSAWR